MERLFAAGILISVAIISFNFFWGGLASNPEYSASNYTNVNQNADFKSINDSSTKIYSKAQDFQKLLEGLQAPGPGTIILSVLGLVSFAMFGVLTLVLTLPLILIDIMRASLNIFGGYISIAALTAGFILILMIRGFMGLLRDQGIVR